MRRVVSLVALVVLVTPLLGARPVGCHLHLRVDTDAPDPVMTAASTVAEGLAERGVQATVEHQAMLASRHKTFDADRLRPLWLGHRDTVEVFADAAGRDRELGRAYLRPGEVLLAAGLLERDAFPVDVWAHTVAHEMGHLAGLDHADGGVMVTDVPPDELVLDEGKLDQLATAWCG